MDTPKKEKQESLLLNLLINIIIPVLILSRLANFVPLEPYQVLIIALAFPVSYAIYDFYQRKKINAISVLGFVSILLTGAIGLFEFPSEWIAVKEAAVPFVIGVAVLISTKTKYPLVRTFIYNEKLLDVQRINTILEENGTKPKLDKALNLSSIFLAMSFFISAILNFTLAKIIIQSPTGTPEFNEELGRMMALSYPVIALPCTIIMIGILFYLMSSIKKYSGLTMDELYSPEIREKAGEKTKE